MKRYHSIKKIFLIFLSGLSLSLFSCNIQKGLQKDIDSLSFTKPINKLNSPLDTLGRRLSANMLMGLSDSSKKALDNILNNVNGALDKLKLDPQIKKLLSAISTMGDTTSLQITKLGNNIHWQIGRMQGDVNGVIDKLSSALDKDAAKLVNDIIQSALNAATTPTSKAKIDSIISNALDKNTDSKAQRLVTSALQPTIDSIANKIDVIVHKEVPFVQKQAYPLLIILGIIAIAIIAFVWYERSKYARLVKILTYQIDKMPKENVGAYDDLTHKIQAHAQNEDLEPLLSKVLKVQGIN